MSDVNPTSTVLIVDDNEMNRDLLVGVLDRDDYQAIAVADGQSALKMVQEKTIDCILLDVNMPMMDGYEVCRRLKADETTADIPVIFISALDQTDHIVRGFDVGGQDYVTKPFRYREVLARVEAQLTLYRQKQQIERMIEHERQHHSRINEMRKKFISSATHDLKNPLLVVRGYADLIERQKVVQEDERVTNYLAAIRRGVNKMDGLVRDMLDLLQLEHGVQLDKENFVFTAFIRENVQDMVMRAQEKSHTFTINVSDDKTKVSLDGKRMGRVLDNLVSNAIKYTREGGDVCVEAGINADEEIAWVEVRDNGLGIPDDVLPDLFTPFQRVNTEEHMEQEGTGLGLSIVKAIVEQHGGTISVKSKLNEGSTFRIELPLN